MVVPVHPGEGGQLDVCGAVPGALAGPSDQFALVEADDGLSQGVVRQSPTEVAAPSSARRSVWRMEVNWADCRRRSAP